MMSASLLHFIIALLYLLLAAREWLAGRLGAEGVRPPRYWLVQGGIPVTLVLHALVLHQVLFVEGQLDLSLGHTLSLLGAVTVATYWLLSLRHPLGVLRPLVLMLAVVLTLAPLVLTGDKPVNYSNFPAFRIHLVVSLTAWSLFAISALHAVLMSVMERRLHQHHFSRIGRWPSLVSMDAMLFRMLWVAFLLLSATLLSGMFFSEELFGKPLVLNHKLVFSVLAWVIYAGMLLGHRLWGLRGRQAARWALAGFFMLLVAYVGSKFVLEILLHRG
jgi:ABC-type uncharacterized transport system permease subunit